ncbi:hypothetical protein BYT27DRAFT_7213573 [Phlegmacium glaucopus]|nr:hypothetical protein BYT27DRAFT_7213573 [Phlegmacium glaucopus]
MCELAGKIPLLILPAIFPLSVLLCRFLAEDHSPCQRMDFSVKIVHAHRDHWQLNLPENHAGKPTNVVDSDSLLKQSENLALFTSFSALILGTFSVNVKCVNGSPKGKLKKCLRPYRQEKSYFLMSFQAFAKLPLSYVKRISTWGTRKRVGHLQLEWVVNWIFFIFLYYMTKMYLKRSRRIPEWIDAEENN